MTTSGPTQTFMRRRYTTMARFYDLLSAEGPVYRAGRLLGIPRLRLGPGSHVVDIGCGTGLNLPLLRDAVGPEGHVTGLDASGDMLRVARDKVGPGGGVTLVEMDATLLADPGARGPVAGPPADGILFTYSLSLMTPWELAWTGALALAGPGARVVVVDMAPPTGKARVLAPLARLACAAGGSDIEASPWTALARDCVDVSSESARGGHIQVWSGTWPGRPS